jgi:hypothetical protein
MQDESSPFRPISRTDSPPIKLRITDEMVQRANELEDPLDLSKTDTTHAFDREAFLIFLHNQFPDLAQQIADAVRPQMSSSPDELEMWESTRILKRKDRFSNETDWAYLIRLLYEEMFAVNQAPNMTNPPMMGGVPGLTIGGLVSHFYRSRLQNGILISQILDYNFSGRTMHQAINAIKESDAMQTDSPLRHLRMFMQSVQYLSQRNDSSPLMNWEVLRSGPISDQVMIGKSDSYKNRYPELDSVGYRLLALLKKEPSFQVMVQDKDLQKLVGVDETRDINRAELLVVAWHYFQRIFKVVGVGITDPTDEVRELVKKMLVFRTHREMAIYFKYFSPSGYLNE